MRQTREKLRVLASLTMLAWLLPASAMFRAHEHVTVPEQEQHNSGWEVYFDDDAFALLPLDQDYTGGFAVTLYGRRAKYHPARLEYLRNKIDQWTGAERRYRSKDVFKLHSFGFGMAAFTPTNIGATAPIYDDRPYASLVYIANTEQVVVPAENQVLQSTLMVGALGLGVAEYIQNSIHSALGQGTANGWDNQISNGGELTFRYTLGRQVAHYKHYVERGVDYEIKGAADISIGYLTDVSAGINTRFGDIHSPWWSFNPHQFDYINMGIPINRTGRGLHIRELFFWGGLNLRYRFYNALLQGQFRNSTVTFTPSEMNPWIVEAWCGVTGRFRSGRTVSFVVRGQTSELKIERRNLIWAGIIFGRGY